MRQKEATGGADDVVFMLRAITKYRLWRSKKNQFYANQSIYTTFAAK